ncbi:hypothetical protein KEM60_02848 [Austwickia sp. TVS 96-490-7B]|nr:hypothetical protein [Austwickia sp. TVS 96-490-7B]
MTTIFSSTSAVLTVDITRSGVPAVGLAAGVCLPALVDPSGVVESAGGRGAAYRSITSRPVPSFAPVLTSGEAT